MHFAFYTLRIISKILYHFGFSLILLFVLTGLRGQDDIAIAIKTYNTADGLSDNAVTAITQDSNCFLWIGTQSGLNRFDGYSFIRYSPGNQTSRVSDGEIIHDLHFQNNTLWICTDKRLMTYHSAEDIFIEQHFPGSYLENPATVFTRIFPGQDSLFWLMNDSILLRIVHEPDLENKYRVDKRIVLEKNETRSRLNYMYEDQYNSLWIGTSDALHTISITDDAEVQVLDNRSIIFDEAVIKIAPVDENNLIITRADSHLLRMNIHTGMHEILPGLEIPSTTDLSLTDVIVDNHEGLWIAHANAGVSRYDLNQKRFTSHFFDQLDNLDNLYENYVNRLFKDRSGSIWACTMGGLARIDVSENNLKVFSQFDFRTYTSTPGDISTIYVDSDRYIWLNHWLDGLFRFLDTGQSLEDHTPEILKRSSTKATLQRILDIFSPEEHIFWFCSGYGHGIFEYLIDDKQELLIKQFRMSDGLPCDSINLIFRDSERQIWVGTKGGLAKYNYERRTFTSRLNNSDSLYSYGLEISAIEQSKDDLWFGTEEGMLIRHPLSATNQWNNPKVYIPPGGWIFSMKFTGDNTLWLGTWNGLFKFNILDESWEKVEDEYLGNNSVSEIQYGIDGELWLGTLNGLVRFNPLTNESYAFSPGEGVRLNHVNYRASDQNSAGTLYFGTKGGLVYFHPDQMVQYSYPPRVKISRLLVDNLPVKIDQFISDENDIYDYQMVLPFDKNSISFEFIGLSYVKQDLNKYAYRLVGLNEDWYNTDFRNRFINYSNLSPGNYVFEVKASNYDGFWSPDILRVNVQIKQIFWKSKVAIVVYILFALIVSFLINLDIRSRRKLREALSREKFERKKIEEINELKLRFFTNVSHEIRSPLTMIINPIEKLLKIEFRSDAKKELGRIKTNATRLLNLVTQLLDYRKITLHGMSTFFIKGNIETFVSKQAQIRKQLAEHRNQTIIFKSELNEKLFVFDKYILEKIISNLISNACKFSPANSEITILLKDAELGNHQVPQNGITISVIDKGRGIPEKYLDKVFDRFFQVNSDGSGSGIGLSLVKELVLAHKGTIAVENNPDGGSHFKVFLPHMQPDRKSATESEGPFRAESLIGLKRSAGIGTAPAERYINLPSAPINPKLLFIDDDKEILNYLEEEFEHTYTVFQAHDGKEGWNTIRKIHPDIVVCDIQMPEVNGWELCKSLKSDMEYSHIPVILLTVEDSDDSRERGYDCGADSYLEKPINLNLLHTRIQNILKAREKSRMKYQKAINIEPKEIASSSMDERFLKRALEIIENNIDNPDFNTEAFSKEIAVSNTQLYKKLKSLIGLSASEFIKDIRLKRAAQLLKNNSHTISEIAYMCGFADPKYFSKCFKNQFGISPKRYAYSNTTIFP